jgi:hypothetical protein
MVDMDTVKILEARRVFLLDRVPVNVDENSFQAKELRALEQTTNFIQWMMNNSSDDIVQKVFEKYKQDDSHTVDKKAGEEDKREGSDSGERATNSGALLVGKPNVFHRRRSKNRTLQIILSKYNGVNYMQLELLRRSARLPLWRRVSYIRLTIHSLERILQRAYDVLNEAVQEQ